METKEAFDLEAFREQQQDTLVFIRLRGGDRSPIYSGDIATAFHINHRALKDVIERDLLHLRKEFGPVFFMREKRAGYARQLNGYFLPVSALVSVLVEALGKDVYTHCDKKLLRQLM